MSISDRELRRLQAEAARAEPRLREALRILEQTPSETLASAEAALNAAPSPTDIGEMRRLAERAAETPIPSQALLDDLRRAHTQLMPDDSSFVRQQKH
jgi:hypothetical protein